MKWLKRLAIFLIVLYLLLCGILFFYQEALLFKPDKLAESHQFRMGEELEIPVEGDIALNALYLKVPKPKGVILYLHGNKGSNRRCLYQSQSFAGNSYNILMLDYRGYGKSDGKIYSEAQVYNDVQKAYDYLKSKFSEDKIVVIGYSMGSGMASYLAEANTPQQLVLVTPYLSIPDLKNRLLPIIPDFLIKYPFDTAARINNIKCPISIFHGTADRVIPYDSSKQLKALREDILLVKLEGTSHRGAIFHDELKETVKKLLR